VNVLTVPRTVLAFEYAAIRRPVTLVENLLVGRLDSEDPRRLGVERALGQVDAVAGRWLDDTNLTARGERAQAHSNAVTEAQKLQAQSEQTKAQADAALGRETKAAEKQRAEAARDHREEVAAAAKQESQHKAEAIRQAKARADAEKETIARQVEATVAGAAARQHAQNAGADNQLKMATAAPTAELADANATEKEAAGQRADADRLAQLAETEKRSRQN
jgi:hypothetical protein